MDKEQQLHQLREQLLQAQNGFALAMSNFDKSRSELLARYDQMILERNGFSVQMNSLMTGIQRQIDELEKQ